jgi:hypothetical protein
MSGPRIYILDYLKRSEVQTRHGLNKTVSLATTQWWIFKLDYCWREEQKGQYVDGHERDDVVTYRQNVFLPLWKVLLTGFIIGERATL